jgi:NADH:ubiquinone oxidoreductase subunit 6 (subunit J)
MIESILFYVFGGATLLALGYMIYTRNVIHGAYGLATVLLSLAGLFILLNAEYLAVVQLFMYAGGVVVLLVFGIMITNRDKKGAPMTSHRGFWASLLIAGLLLSLLIIMTLNEGFKWEGQYLAQDQTKAIGKLFLTDHLVAFELVAVLLLSVLVGAAFLAKKSSSNE